MEADEEWSTHKKLINTSEKGLQRCVPKVFGSSPSNSSSASSFSCSSRVYLVTFLSPRTFLSSMSSGQEEATHMS